MEAAKGSLVMAAAQVISRPINAIALVFLARLLDPQDFGIVAMAMVLLSATDLFSGLGLDNALIHSPLDKRTIAFQSFVVTFLFSLSLYLVLAFNAPFFARLLGDDEVTPVIRWLSALTILDACYLVPNSLLRKDMIFGQVSKSIIFSTLAYNAVALSFAFLGFGFWSLVYGELARSLVKVAVVWLAYPGWDWLIPRRWDWPAMKGLLRYGIQSTGSGFLSFFNSNWDDWLVGRMLGTAALGFYSKAYSLSNDTIVGFNRRVINSVLFPAYAKIQDEHERLSHAFIKSLGVSALVMAPLAMGVFAIAAQAVPILLGEKWNPMVPTLQIFTFMALVRPLAGSTSPLFQAVGRPDLNLRAGLVQLAVMAPLIFLLLPRGILGVAIGVTAAFGVGFLYNIYQMHRILPGIAPKMILAILPALGASMVMVAGVYLSKPFLLRLVGGEHNLLSLLIMIAIGALLYLATAFLTQRALLIEGFSLLKSVLGGRRRFVFGKHHLGG